MKTERQFHAMKDIAREDKFEFSQNYSKTPTESVGVNYLFTV